MRIIIAPAKKMVVDTGSFAVDSLPQFLEQTERLKTVLQGMSPKGLQALWKCNDTIAKLNVEPHGTSLDTVPQGLSCFLAGSGLIFCAQQEICGACRFDSLIIFVYLLADIWMSLYC